MFKYTKHIIVLSALLFNNFLLFGQDFKSKQEEIVYLEGYTKKKLREIDSKRNIRFKDYLRLLPNVSYSRNYSQTVEEPNDSVSLSINTNQIFSIAQKQENSKKNKQRAKRQILSYKFKIRKMVERKYLLKTKIWQYRQIRKSTTNPVRRAALDEKIDDTRVKLQDVLISIEAYYAEMDMLVEGL